MARAKDDLMDMLHSLTATKLADIIENGVPVFNAEGEETGRNPAPAPYISAAIKFLKDNDVTSEPDADRFNPLKDALEDVPEFDEDADYVN